MQATQSSINYDRIAAAIHFIKENFRQQPDLDAVARHVHLSPFHFQRLFREWAGVTPKKFVQYLSVNYARERLQQQATLFDTAVELGLSGSSRLHDLFIQVEAMTPGEYKNGGATLTIRYSFATTVFGEVMVASTSKGVCYLAFADDHKEARDALRRQFPQAVFEEAVDPAQQAALQFFRQDWSTVQQVKLHVKGTPFQLKVWEALLKVPAGALATYAGICSQIGQPGASRAVGTAVGANPVAVLIPCHRVIRSTGESGEYHWGSTRKTALIGWEAARLEIMQEG